MDVGAWLRSLGLERYDQAFRDNDVGADVLPDLTAEDLVGLGVTSIGHRRTLLAAIAALRAGPSPSGAASAPVERAPDAIPTANPPDAERRQLTVMFVDLVGSTAMSARLDPEDLRDVIGAYHRFVAAAVGRHGGFVAKYMGDGVLAYFGYPRANEDDAERAVRAGMAIVEAAGELPAPETEGQLRARVGIATGLVVVGDLVDVGEARERGVVGETPNLAARLQALAEPDAVVIGPQTRRLLGGLFECRDLGDVAVKGLDERVRAYRVLRPSGIDSRFEALHGGAAGALTPLVGREEEIELLLRRWRQARDGEGRAVLLSGEAGIGKSRIARAVQERLADEPHTRLLYFCSPHHRDSALHPFVRQLERAAGFERNNPADVKLDRLEALLASSSRDVARDAAMLAELLSIPSGDRYPPRPDLVSPQKRKEETLAALLAQLDGLAAHRPVLLVFEDAHWIDPTSLELLERTIDRVHGLPVLLIVTARPEFAPPWAGRPHVTVHPLNRLSRRDAAALIGRVTGGRDLPREVEDQIVARTDGVPLFVEELTKTILESGALRGEGDRYVLTAPLPSHAIPTTLHASLAARLDRLSPVRKIAEIGAAIGREFSHELIAAVAAETPASELDDALRQLVASELLYSRGTPPDAVYTFKHALVQDAAYCALLRGARQQLHARIAGTLEARFPEVVAAQPELLARHCTEGGLAERAVGYWLAAAERALRAAANAEAIEHLSRGIQLLTSSLPDTPERRRTELRFQTMLGPALLATKGWAAAEAAQAYHRAEELCRALGDPGERFKVVVGLWFFHLTRGETRQAGSLGEELFRLAEQQNDDDLRLQALHAAWGRSMWVGQFAAGLEYAERGLALYSPSQHASHALTYGGHDPGVCGWARGGMDLWFLGYPDRADEYVRRALALAEEIAHPPTVAHALNYGILCQQLRRDAATVRSWGERLASLAAEHGLALFAATAISARGWTLANDGRVTSSLAELRRGLDGCIGLGMRLFEPYHKALLADVCLAAGDRAAALRLVEDAMRFAEESGVRFWDAELLRLKGKLLARLSPGGAGPQEVEACYQGALAIARGQQARSLELRAAMGLARLWRDQGRHAEARELLAPIYGWFTEGFDTPDLSEAKELLDALT